MDHAVVVDLIKSFSFHQEKSKSLVTVNFLVILMTKLNEVLLCICTPFFLGNHSQTRDGITTD